MRTKISRENPYGHDPHGFAWEHVPAGGRAHLDFGCGGGRFLNSLSGKGIARLVGVDISAGAAARARRDFPALEIVHVRKTIPLPFEDGCFASATLLDVLEHVYEQPALLAELHRVLVPGGPLIVTVPRRHLFSFLDRGNLKFLLPSLHRWHYCRRHSRAEYDRRYAANPDGLIGDVSARKRWHEHFTPGRLGWLLGESGFSVVEFDGCGLLLRPIGLLAEAVKPLAAGRRALKRLARLDAKRYQWTNLFCISRKDG